MSITVDRAIILAAGLGTRLRPLTNNIPKPLVEVGGKTLIDWTLETASDGGVRIAVINTSYLAQMVETHVARRTAPSIIISRETEPLETGGGIANALPLLGESSFFAMNSDTICLPGPVHHLTRMREHWDSNQMDALLLLQPKELAIGFDGPGDFSVAKAGHVIRRGDADHAPYVFTGVQLLDPRLFDGCRKFGDVFSMNALYDRNLTRIHALIHDGDWLHVGDIKGLAAAESFLSMQD